MELLDGLWVWPDFSLGQIGRLQNCYPQQHMFLGGKALDPEKQSGGRGVCRPCLGFGSPCIMFGRVISNNTIHHACQGLGAGAHLDP